MAKSRHQRIDELEKRREQLAAQIQREKAKIRVEQRKQDTRRKILAGAIALEHAEIDQAFGATLYSTLQKVLTRPDDRALFGFEPLSEAAPQSGTG